MYGLARMENAFLTSALLESAWITSRISVGIGLAVWIAGVLLARGRPRAPAGAPAHARRGALPRALAQGAALVAGGALCALTRGEAERLLPAWGQGFVAALAALMAPVGGMLGAWSARELGPGLVPGAEVRAGAPLVTTGPFGIVRHPFYLSLALWAGAAGLALGSLSGTALLLALFLVASAWRARLEDRVLAEAFPREFPPYAARVRAFLPRI